MEYDELKRLVRESYPLPIAHAHKKTMGLLDDDAQKLKCLLETAENTIQFLALTALAQLSHDLRQGNAPGQQGLHYSIRDNLRNPSFGKWSGILREVMKGYRDSKNLLVVPELFDFCFQDSGGRKLRMQPIHERVIGPLNNIRNDFHHLRISESQVSAKVSEGLMLLHQLLESLRFLSGYQLSFIQRIMADRDKTDRSTYTHDMVQFSGCFSTPDQVRWESRIHLQKGVIVFLHGQEGKHLILNPFVTFADRIPVPGVQDVFLLNKTDRDQCFYVSSQFGQTLGTKQEGWVDGPSQQDALIEFFDRLRMVKDSGEPVEIDLSEQSLPQEIASTFSTAEVFQKQYLKSEAEIVHASPYKFLDYYNPEDHDLFFGRDQEIRILQQKFHGTRLLILHGESGTGKSSLIRAGLIPGLSSESYVAVYVRALKEPINEIKKELIRQLNRDERNLQLPLAQFIQRETELLSKTVVIVLDQFEEFFLRLPEEVRREFIRELSACLETPQLDVKFLISLRDDFFAHLGEFEPEIPQIFTHQFQLNHLNESQALEAVVEPPTRLGIEIDEEMVREKILPELLSDEGVEAPLLQIVCDALYQNANGEGRATIDMRDFEAIGDVKGTLGRYLETKLRQFGTNQREAKEVLKALVTVQGTKQTCFIDDLLSRINSSGLTITKEDLTKNYLDKFIRDRLVRVDEVDGRARYELSHEYLVRHIEAWIEETDRKLKKVLELIDRAYEAYKATGLLLESSALDLIAPFRQQLVQTSEKEAFLEESITRARQKRRGLLMKVAAMLVGVAIVSGGFFGYKLYQSYQREKEKLREARHNLGLTFLEKMDNALASKNINAAYMYSLQALSKFEKSTSKDDLELPLRVRAIGTLLGKQDYPLISSPLLNSHSAINCISFSPDGKTLAIGATDNTIRLWDVNSGKELKKLEGHTDGIASISFSADGKMLASGSLDKTIFLWNLDSGKEIGRVHEARSVWSVSFSPDGKILASGLTKNTIHLWDVSSLENIEKLQGTILVSDSSVAERQRKEGFDEQYMEHIIGSIAFSPNGELLAAGSLDEAIYLCDVSSGKEISRLEGQTGAIFSVAFSPNGMILATGSGDKTIRLWDVRSRTAFGRLEGHSDQVLSVSFSPDGSTLASGSFDKTIRLWDVRSRKLIAKIEGHASPVNSVSFSPDGKMLASGSGDGIVNLWNMNSRREVKKLIGHGDGVKGIFFSPDGKTLVSEAGVEIFVWEVDSGKVLNKMIGSDIALSPDGKTLAYYTYKDSDSSYFLENLGSGGPIRKLDTLGKPIYTRAYFSPDGRTLAAYVGDNINLWDVSTAKTLHNFEDTSGLNPALSFSPDGKILASRSLNFIRLWDVITGKEIKASLQRDTSLIPLGNCLSFSPDGILAADLGDRICLWDVRSGEEIHRLEGRSGIVNSISFSHGGRILASGSNDNTVILWDARSGTELCDLRGHAGEVLYVLFSRDGMVLASGSKDKTIYLWDFSALADSSLDQRIVDAKQQYNLELQGIDLVPIGAPKNPKDRL